MAGPLVANGRGVLASAVLLLAAGSPPPRYRALTLACAVFSEVSVAEVRGESGTAQVRDRVRRSGTLVTTAKEEEHGIALVAWYDSLALVRETEAGAERPDTDGFLGGRYRGVLSADGRYRQDKAPFVPDDLAAETSLETALDDFFPRLAPEPLEPGREWKDGAFTIRRVNDTKDAVGLVEHYTWTDTRRIGTKVDAGDSLSVRLDQLVKEKGELAWSERLGPLQWTRHIAVSAHVPATGGVVRSVRSTVDQEISVIRRFDLKPACQPETVP